MDDRSASPLGAAAALKKGLVGKALDTEIRRLSACTAQLTIEHEILPSPNNRLTLSDKKDWLGLNKPNIYYDVGDYVRQSAKEYTVPRLRELADALGATSFQLSPEFLNSDHIMGGCIMGADAATSVVDADCRAHDHHNLFLPGGGAMPSGTALNSTLSMAALAVKASDAVVDQLRHG
jgi:fructose 5-dehydrogenase large subunit